MPTTKTIPSLIVNACHAATGIDTGKRIPHGLLPLDFQRRIHYIKGYDGHRDCNWMLRAKRHHCMSVYDFARAFVNGEINKHGHSEVDITVMLGLLDIAWHGYEATPALDVGEPVSTVYDD